MTTIIIFGPPASGKTSYAERLKHFFGCSHIYEDDGRHDMKFPERGALILTSSEPEEIRCWQMRKVTPGQRDSLIFQSIYAARRRIEPGKPLIVKDEHAGIGPMDTRSERERNLDQAADFWLIWSPTGKRPPAKQHYTQASAQREAERLAANNPGQQFYVLEPRYEVAALLTRIRHGSPIAVSLDEEVPF